MRGEGPVIATAGQPGPGRPQRRAKVRYGPLTLDLERREAVVFGRTVALTRLEFDLLHTLIDAPGRTFSRDELLARLHAADGKSPTDRALDNLIVRLRRKLHDNSRRPRLIQAVWGVGYRLISPATAAAVELARQAIELLPVPAFLIDRERVVVAANGPARRELQGLAEGGACFELLYCREGTCALKDQCYGLEAMARRVPLTADYTIATSAGPAAVLAQYLPVTAGHTSLCMLVVSTRPRV